MTSDTRDGPQMNWRQCGIGTSCRLRLGHDGPHVFNAAIPTEPQPPIDAAIRDIWRTLSGADIRAMLAMWQARQGATPVADTAGIDAALMATVALEDVYCTFARVVHPTGTLGRASTRRAALGTAEAIRCLRQVIDEYAAALRTPKPEGDPE